MEAKKCNNCDLANIWFSSLKCGSPNAEIRDNFKRKGTTSAENCSDYKFIDERTHSRITLDRALKFMLAGRSEFKLISGETGKTLYFKLLQRASTVETESNPGEPSQSVYWLNAGEEEGNLRFLGTLYFNVGLDSFLFSKCSTGTGFEDTLEVKAILYVLNRLHHGKYDTNVEVHTQGKCGYCGKRLSSVNGWLTGLCSDCGKRLTKTGAQRTYVQPDLTLIR